MNMSPHGPSPEFDCIVLGLGGVGSAALYDASARGWKVLGIDRFGIAHARGSSHGQTRIIRTAYFEHPNYVPLAKRAFQMWDELQRGCHENLITRTGLIQVGDPDGEVIRGVQHSALQHGLEIETLTAREVAERFPVFKEPTGRVGIYEREAGFLRVERCVANFVAKARELGASISTDDAVVGWRVNDNETVEVHTASGKRHTSRRLIIAAGAWSEPLLGLPLQLEVVRKQQLWFAFEPLGQSLQAGFACFLFDTEHGVHYGFPEIDSMGMKIAKHDGGQPVTDPTQVDRELDQADLAGTLEFIKDHFRFAQHRLIHDSVCMYTKSRDEHFLIDYHPEYRQVVFAAGLSGHGFKFTPVIGRRLIEMLEHQPDELFDFFKLSIRTP
jgi:sarcosine oxidase